MVLTDRARVLLLLSAVSAATLRVVVCGRHITGLQPVKLARATTEAPHHGEDMRPVVDLRLRYEG